MRAAFAVVLMGFTAFDETLPRLHASRNSEMSIEWVHFIRTMPCPFRTTCHRSPGVSLGDTGEHGQTVGVCSLQTAWDPWLRVSMATYYLHVWSALRIVTQYAWIILISGYAWCVNRLPNFSMSAFSHFRCRSRYDFKLYGLIVIYVYCLRLWLHNTCMKTMYVQVQHHRGGSTRTELPWLCLPNLFQGVCSLVFWRYNTDWYVACWIVCACRDRMTGITNSKVLMYEQRNRTKWEKIMVQDRKYWMTKPVMNGQLYTTDAQERRWPLGGGRNEGVRGRNVSRMYDYITGKVSHHKSLKPHTPIVAIDLLGGR